METPLEVYETLPLVPLRDVVVFPHMMMPFVIGRPSSTRALEHALLKDKRIFLAAQHDASIDDPRPEDVFTMGCVANVVQSLKLPDGNIKVLVEGVDRARAVEWKEDKGFYRVVVKVLPKQREASSDAESTMSRVVSLFEQYVKLSNNLHYDAMIAAVRVDGLAQLSRLADRSAVVQEEPREPRPQARRGDSSRRSLRARQDQGAHPRVPGGARARKEAQGHNPHILRASGRRQNVARQIDCPRDESQVRKAFARRRARRGRDPRPPAHLHRGVPRPDHPDD